MSNDIYAPPTTEPKDIEIDKTGHELASRGLRLGGSLIDSVVMMLFTVPLMYLTGGFDNFTDPENQPSHLYNVGIGIAGLVFFFALNCKFLVSNGQTIGKKLVGTKMVTIAGQPVTFKDNLIKRYGVFFGLGQIPVAGQILSLINTLFIFGKPHRCGHDYAGNTKVVKAN